MKFFISFLKPLFKFILSRILNPISKLPKPAQIFLGLTLSISFAFSPQVSISNGKNTIIYGYGPIGNSIRQIVVSPEFLHSQFLQNSNNIEDVSISETEISPEKSVMADKIEDSNIAIGDNSIAIEGDFVVSGDTTTYGDFITNIIYQANRIISLSSQVSQNETININSEQTQNEIEISAERIKVWAQVLNEVSNSVKLNADCPQFVSNNPFLPPLPSSESSEEFQLSSSRADIPPASEIGDSVPAEELESEGPPNRSRGWDECGKGDHPIPCSDS
ncbi:MAG: hypothetical protein AAGA83_15165 [Cyanobacteria bacterium P01_F01_bin.116]